METTGEDVLVPIKRRKRQLATYAWLACNTREDEGPNLPRELVHKIARYVHDEKDGERTFRTYNRIDKFPVKVYDESIDTAREYKPAAVPYYVIQRSVHKCKPIFKMDSRGCLVETGNAPTKLVTHTVRIVSEAEFERLCSQGVTMWMGHAWNAETGDLIPAERPYWYQG